MKSQRHAAIAKLVMNESIETQEDLARMLRSLGYSVTQATVSRDIKEMRLIKILTPEGKYKYATVDNAESDLQDRFNRIFSSSVLSVNSSGNLIVIKTISGSANAAAEAIDSMKWPDVLGTFAGDNTVFIVVKEGRSVIETIKRFQNMISG